MHTDQSAQGGPSQSQPDGEEGKELPAWKIYPPPPPPHWHWKPSSEGQAPKLEHRDSDAAAAGENAQPGNQGSTTDSNDTAGSGPANGPYKTAGKPDMYVFNKDDCQIPAKDTRWTFELDDEGVYQVYARKADADDANAAVGEAAEANAGKAKGKREKLARIPDLREYFTDLDYLLNVCSDGPAKSFAFRRLKYLASKWSLYCLLNEYQELADMKAVPHRYAHHP
jgi:AMP deaminase